MSETDLQLGGGYTYQWECAILLALNYFFEPVRYNPTLFDLVDGFLGQVTEIHLEGEDRESGVDLEDINLVGDERRILIQVKTKQAEGERWTPSDPLLLKALYRFYDSRFLAAQPEATRFVFLTNRPFNPALVRAKAAIKEEAVSQCAEAEALCQHLARYARREKDTSIDVDRFWEMLAQAALVEYLGVDEVKANVQAKLQAYGRRDWKQAHAVLFEHFSRQSVRVGGGAVTRASVVEALGPPPPPPEARRPKALFAGVPAERPHFVGREELLGELAGRLTSGEARSLALEGLPGVGKTALAAALARHPEVMGHFADGVLWGGLGPPGQADPARALAGWAEALGRDVSDLLDREERQEAVRNLIGGRRMLLVVDDAWELEAAEALRCGGPNC